MPDRDPQLGDQIAIVNQHGKAIAARAYQITDDRVYWESLGSDDHGVVPRTQWVRCWAQQQAIIDSGILGDRSEKEPIDSQRARASFLKIGQLCGHVANLEELSRVMHTKVIGSAAADLRRIQQIVFEMTGDVPAEKQW